MARGSLSTLFPPVTLSLLVSGGGPVAARLAENGFSDPQLELNYTVYTYDEFSPGAEFPRDDTWKEGGTCPTFKALRLTKLSFNSDGFFVVEGENGVGRRGWRRDGNLGSHGLWRSVNDLRHRGHRRGVAGEHGNGNIVHCSGLKWMAPPAREDPITLDQMDDTGNGQWDLILGLESATQRS
ncbi:hypothetical protein B0H14DRAFT_3168380 [Mycena olivaceomarginata]|nr:hypothetical protein B0H14DRAFT_3168380 [Mycena olivaceomarginata]